MPVEDCSERHAQIGSRFHMQLFLYENFLHSHKNILLALSQNNYAVGGGLESQFQTYVIQTFA